MDSGSLGIIAGKGAYPCLLAASARKQGVQRLVAVAFKKETDPAIQKLVDETIWLHVGQLAKLLEAFQQRGVKQVVMAGQITPTHLFRVRPDSRMIQLLAGLNQRNAHTIFGAVGDALQEVGVELKPASLFMESAMPEAGVLTRRRPTEAEQQDIELGLHVARTTSRLDIGQTVVIKQGTILAVEAFEGTDRTIRRAAKLGGPGIVVVKAAKPGHDMRFDIPVVGMRTLKLLGKRRAGVLAVQAGRSILLEQSRLIEAADRFGICITVVPVDEAGGDADRPSGEVQDG